MRRTTLVTPWSFCVNTQRTMWPRMDASSRKIPQSWRPSRRSVSEPNALHLCAATCGGYSTAHAAVSGDTVGLGAPSGKTRGRQEPWTTPTRQCSSFMENYYIDKVELGILKGKLLDPIRADKPYQTIATEDIGAFVALAFERPQEFVGLALEIAGSELTNPEAAEVFSRVLGRSVKFQKLPMPMVRLALGREFYQMFRWFNAAGCQADIGALRRQYPEVHLQTLEEWLRNEGWHKRALRVRAPKGS